MTAINSLVYEGLSQPIRNFIHDVHHNPDKAVSKSINAGSLAAALYHLYKGTKGKDNKLDAFIDSLPKAAATAFSIAMAGHAIHDLSKGAYAYDPAKNPILNKSPFKYQALISNQHLNPSPENLTPQDINNLHHFQTLTPQQQQVIVNHYLGQQNHGR